MVYEISYDLHKPGRDYTSLYTAIKALGNWCHPLDSTWFVVSSLTTAEIRDRLGTYMDYSDSLIVAQMSGAAAWRGLSQQVTDWLKDILSTASVR